jgi:Patched family
MHILLRYYESKCNTREGKVKDALGTLGISILIGGLSTFLGVIPLAFSTSAILRTVFTAFFAMVTLGLAHGLILLPVILSLWGPIPCAPTHNVGGEQQEQQQQPVMKQHEGLIIHGLDDSVDDESNTSDDCISVSERRNIYSVPLGFSAITDDDDRSHVLLTGTNIKVRLDSLVEC